MLLVTLLLGYQLVTSRLEDSRKALEERGTLIARQLALAGEYALFTRNRTQLKGVLDAVLGDPQLRWAALIDDKERPVSWSGPVSPSELENVLAYSGRARGNEILYSSAVISLATPVDDFAAKPPTGADQLLGWAVVCLSLEPTLARESAIFLNSLFLILLGVVVSVPLALAIRRGIARPILNLTRIMGRVHQGDLSARADTRSTAELRHLEDGFNQMVESLETAQRGLHGEIEAATRQLRSTVAELEVKNRELDIAHEQALAAGREKSDFLARMSHEIRTPLNAIVGFARLLQERPESGDIDEFTRTIQRAASHLLFVIDGILDFTRIEAGCVEIESAVFNPRSCMEDVVSMLVPAVQDKPVELVLLIHNDVPAQLVGDSSRVTQVLMNLVSNAIKFTEQGHVLIEAEWQRPTSGRGRLRVTVEDTGIGIAPEDQRRLFQAFSQMDSTITRRYGGAGLGLAISKRLAVRMGGDILVESTKLKGSRFLFSFPSEPKVGQQPGEAEVLLQGQRVLLYERHPLSRRALRSVLTGWGMQVFQTGRSSQAHSWLERAADTPRAFDVLVLGLARDEQIDPSLGELLGPIQSRFAGPVLILVGTQLWQPPSLTGGQRLNWVTKPFRRAQIFRSLLDLLDLQEPVRPSPPTERKTEGPNARTFTGMRVLIVEDNELNRLLLHRLLNGLEMHVEEAADGESAVKAATAGNYELILMDLHMPGMGGADAARLIRGLLGNACPPILALTADVFAGESGDIALGTFDDHLLKPVSAQSLEAAIRRHAISPAQTTGPRHNGSAPILDLPRDMDQRLRAEFQRLRREIEQAASAGDVIGLLDPVHQLRGLMGLYCDLPELSDAAADLEEAIRRPNGGPVHEQIQRLLEHLGDLPA